MLIVSRPTGIIKKWQLGKFRAEDRCLATCCLGDICKAITLRIFCNIFNKAININNNNSMIQTFETIGKRLVKLICSIFIDKSADAVQLWITCNQAGN